MRNTRQSAVKPQSRVFSDPAVNAIYWAMHEGSGIAITDRFGRVPAFDLVGTTTGLWANRLSGMTADAAGNAGPKLALANLAPLDLSTVAPGEKLVFAMRVQKSANPSGSAEKIFTMGSTDGAGNTGHATGCIQLTIQTNGNMQMLFRPRSSADAVNGINSFASVGNVGIANPHHVVFILDMTDPAAPLIYGLENGTQRALITPDMSASVGLPVPNTVNGIFLGTNGLANGSASTAARMGQNGTGLRLGEFLIWRTSQALDRVLRVMDFHRVNRTLPAWMEA